MDKNLLRKWARDKRNELDMAAISTILAEKFVQTQEYKQAKNVMLFYPLKNEVNLLSILDDKSKTFYLPRIKENGLECCQYSIGDELCDSCFHTKEPVCEACEKSNIDLVVVPALACDENNYRLGYGGGFYDRFLQDFKGKKVVCIPKEMIVETVYPENHDIKMDLILHS